MNIFLQCFKSFTIKDFPQHQNSKKMILTAFENSFYHNSVVSLYRLEENKKSIFFGRYKYLEFFVLICLEDYKELIEIQDDLVKTILKEYLNVSDQYKLQINLIIKSNKKSFRYNEYDIKRSIVTKEGIIIKTIIINADGEIMWKQGDQVTNSLTERSIKLHKIDSLNDEDVKFLTTEWYHLLAIFYLILHVSKSNSPKLLNNSHLTTAST